MIPCFGAASRSVGLLVFGAMLVGPGSPGRAWADPVGKDTGYGWCGLHGNYQGASCPSCASNSGGSSSTGTRGPSRAEKARLKAIQEEEEARERRRVEALDANERGVAACDAAQWGKAVALFREAVEKNPDSAVMQKNLSFAQGHLDEQLTAAREERERKTSLAGVQSAIKAFSQTSGQIDFDGGGLGFITSVPNSSNVAAAGPGALQFGDPMVVDARNVPSGLPKAMDDAIASVYGKAPPGVSDAVRKGFQALTVQDWKTAKAWFGDALRRDPANAGLKRLLAIAAEPAPAERTPMKVHSEKEWKTFLQLPAESDVLFLFPGETPGYVTNPDGTVLQVPLDSDIRLMFPENP